MRGLLVIVLIIFLSATAIAQRKNYSLLKCPQKCYCYQKTVRCMKLDLQQVPRVPGQTVMLDLRFNHIKQVHKGAFKGNKGLVTLLLNNNNLEGLKNDTFHGLIHVQNLYLYRNRIRHIESGAFQGLYRLERLYLHFNQLNEFQPGTFSNLPSLDRLYLYSNELHNIPKGAFQNLPKLKRLRLDHNALVCDCKMAWLSRMLSDKAMQVSAHCAQPTAMSGKSIIGMDKKHFHCEPPKIVENPHDVQITLGGTAMFSCTVQSDETPFIVWMKGEKELIPDDQKYKMMDNGTLMIHDTKEEDGGFYECLAKNPEGESRSRPARMVVYREQNEENRGNYNYGLPRFIVVPSTVTTVPGAQEVTLHCEAVGYPQPTITWSKNGVQMSPSQRYIFNYDGSLTIRHVEGSDHGTYMCEAKNYNGRVTAEAYILIQVAPIFTIQPENTHAIVGSTIKLECVASGTPIPEITWFKDDLEVLPNDERIFYNHDRSLLEIRKATEADSGLYICEARNEIGTREVSAKVKVAKDDIRPPKLIYKPYNMEALIGSTIELPCKAAGDPVPSINWQKDGERMAITGRWKISISGNLYIYKVAPEDQGRYECSAFNEHGRDTASGYVTVISNNDPTQPGGVGDKFIKIAFTEASQEIDKAINNTIYSFLNNKNPTSSELFRIIRYPNAPARELAKAAEVYERTLVNIRKHIERDRISMNNTKKFDYREILSPDKLELIARLSGCTAHRHTKNCTDMCFHSKYRSIDGTCNNLQHTAWGASLTGFRRVLNPIYEDGFGKPIGWEKGRLYNGYPKPPSRKVSTTLIATNKITPDQEITHMVMQWGQFLDHDLDHALPSVSSESWDGIDCKKSCEYAAPCYPMDVPEDDPRIHNRRCIDFVRTSAVCGSGMTSIFFDTAQHREQINQLTSYIDASMVYGFSEELAREVRDTDSELGRLKEGVIFDDRKPLLPYSTNQMDCRRNLSESDVSCFLAGDIRANEQSGLTAMHTLWMREHNRLTKELRFYNPHWDTDMLYQEARKIVGAAIQHITYKQWLQFIVGSEGLRQLGPYTEYNPQLNPSISNVFATAALRFGHSLINPVLQRLNWEFKPIREGHLPLHKAFFSPWRIVDEGGIDPLLRGMFVAPAKKKMPRENLNIDLTEHLFETAHAVALDLAAMNIHRSREHGMPGYIAYRDFCNMTAVKTFEDLAGEISDPEVRRKLQELYGHPANIDVWVGGILEDTVEGGRVGPLFRCLLLEQFHRLRDGDRFWYENPSVFKSEQLTQIKQYSLARVLCDNGDNITRVTKNVFVLPELQGGFVNCEDIPKVDLRLWAECCSDCRYSGQLNTISRLNFRRSKRDTTQIDDGDISEGSTLVDEEPSSCQKDISDLKEENGLLRKKINEIEEMMGKILGKL